MLVIMVIRRRVRNHIGMLVILVLHTKLRMMQKENCPKP